MKIFDIPMELDECNIHSAGHYKMLLPWVDKDEKYFCLVSVTSGSGVIHTFGKAFKIGTGCVFLAFPYEKFRIETDKNGKLEYNLLCFSLTSKKHQRILCNVKLAGMNEQERIHPNHNVSSAMNSIFKEFEQPRVSREITSLLCSQIIVYMVQQYSTFSIPVSDSDDITSRLCVLVMNYIDSHIFDIKNLSEIANTLGYNYCYLSSLFRKTTGNTIKNYFADKKMAVAAGLLSGNKRSVSVIAKNLNYSGVYAFSKAFKAHFGVSPVKYRQINQ